jgi:hypothetical protein
LPDETVELLRHFSVIVVARLNRQIFNKGN